MRAKTYTCAGMASGVIWYRWLCRHCPLHGEWQQSLDTAEREGKEHERLDHAQKASA